MLLDPFNPTIEMRDSPRGSELRTLPIAMKDTLAIIIRVFNYVKANAVNAKLFAKL